MDFFDADVLIGRQIDQDEEQAPTVDDLIAELDRNGVARSLVTNQKIVLSNPDWGNDDLQRDASRDARLRPVYGAYVTAEREGVSMEQSVDRLIKMNAAGVQIWPAQCAWEMAVWQCPDFFAAVSARRLPLFMHADQSNWNSVYAVLKAFPRLVLVVQRVSYMDSRKLLALMQACPNLHLCLSPAFVGGSTIEYFNRHVGCDRMLFGSGLFRFDCPPAMGQVAYCELTDAQKAMIAGGNLARLLEAIQ